MLVMVHCEPAITAPLRSVTLPEMRAPSVCASKAASLRRRIAMSKRHFIKALRMRSHATPTPLRAEGLGKSVLRMELCRFAVWLGDTDRLQPIADMMRASIAPDTNLV